MADFNKQRLFTNIKHVLLSEKSVNFSEDLEQRLREFVETAVKPA